MPEPTPAPPPKVHHKVTRPPWPVLTLLAGLVAVEGAMLSVNGLRGVAFATMAFDPRLLEVARPLYPGHGWAMFLTHIFVHIGPLHMLGNLLALYLLWYLMPWMYTSDYIIVFFGGALGGALVFSWFGPPGATMTGASGAATALAAVWGIYEMFLINRGYVLSLRPKRTAVLVGLVVVGVLLNIDHRLDTAWQAHLGGAIAGLAFGIGLIARAIIEKRYGPTDPREQPSRDGGHDGSA